jgi:biotin carboxylase
MADTGGRVRLYLVASKPTDAVRHGFLPAAARLGLDVVLLTDQPEAHQTGPVQVMGCDVRDADALIGRIGGLRAPDAIVTNSDRLQVQTALAAAYYGLPGKDWRSALRARDKLAMRRRLAATGTEKVAAVEITAGPVPDPTYAALPYPVVLKPAEGVASEDVTLVADREELVRRCADYFARHPGGRLIAEEFLPGTLRTLETLSDGRSTWVLGGFRTTTSAPPYFIEARLTWDPLPAGAELDHVTAALGDLGVTFGACHTEFICDGQGGAALVEVNDRLIGDHCEFLLSDLLGVDLFERVLRVHLGEHLPAGPPQAGPGQAIADYIAAERSGVLRSAPPPGPVADGEPGVRLGYWPLRQTGEHVTVTGSNRDYLGVITAVGSDPAAVQRSVAAARARLCPEIVAEPAR